MAFNLIAKLQLKAGSFLDQMKRVENATERADKATKRLEKSHRHMQNGMNKRYSHGGILSLETAFYGVAAAIGAATAAKKIFDATIGEAALYEQSAVTIKAMFNDEQLSKQYMDLVDRFAVDSPILNSQDMLANSKSFIVASKDLNQLEQMWSLAERLSSIDPTQGIEGAVFSLRELFSGDAISMAKRFELDGNLLNEIKNLPLEQQLARLDEYFNKIGLTQKLIDEQGGTTLGLWNQIKERMNVTFRDMGKPALEKIRKFLNDTNNEMGNGSLEGFQKWGARVLASITESAIAGIKGLKNWIQEIQNDPEFQRQTTLFGKVKFVFDDIYDKFIEWLDGGGQDSIAKITADLIQILAAGIEASMGAITPIATKLGAAIGEGILDGAKAMLEDSWLMKAAEIATDPSGSALEALLGIDMEHPIDFFNDKANLKAAQKLYGGEKYRKNQHSGGLNFVPYNGYKASLHKGEQILTRSEANEYRKGKNDKSFAINIANMNVRKESDITKIAETLADIIEAAGGAGA